MKVLIPTSGKGDRLGKYTEYTNKSLIRIGDMAAISHIIDLYPNAEAFVVTLGYNGRLVRKYLTMAHANRTFNFVEVDKYEGEGSSLLYSIFQAKDYLREPFIFHACDTILTIPPPDPSTNYMLGCKYDYPEHYRSFAVNSLNEIVRINDEKQQWLDDSEYCYVGVAGINSHEKFWEITNLLLNKRNGDLSDVHVFKELLGTVQAKFTMIDDWYDIGNMSGLNRTKKTFPTSYHVLDKYNEDIFIVDSQVIKFFHDTNVCKNRVYRANRYMADACPEITNSSINFYSYTKVNGKVFSSTVTENKLHDFLEWMQMNFWNNYAMSFNIQEQCREFYITKTRHRLKQYLKGKKEEIVIINGESIPTVQSLVKTINRLHILFMGVSNRFHGDLVLDNIIDTTYGDFVLIDWRHDFCGELNYGDMYYDLAKLGHSLLMKHSVLLNREFSIEKIPNDACPEYRLDVLKSDIFLKCLPILQNWCKKNKFYWGKIMTIISLIWINMAPLHDEDIGEFLYLYGRYHLCKSIKRLNVEHNIERRAKRIIK